VFPGTFPIAAYGGVYRDYPRQVHQVERDGGKQQNLPTVSQNLGAVRFPFLGQWWPHLYDIPRPWDQDWRNTSWQLRKLLAIGDPAVPFPRLGQWWPHAYDGPDQTSIWQRGSRPLAPIGAPPVGFSPGQPPYPVAPVSNAFFQSRPASVQTVVPPPPIPMAPPWLVGWPDFFVPPVPVLWPTPGTQVGDPPAPYVPPNLGAAYVEPVFPVLQPQPMATVSAAPMPPVTPPQTLGGGGRPKRQRKPRAPKVTEQPVERGPEFSNTPFIFTPPKPQARTPVVPRPVPVREPEPIEITPERSPEPDRSPLPNLPQRPGRVVRPTVPTWTDPDELADDEVEAIVVGLALADIF
jgi:hypothetical protein